MSLSTTLGTIGTSAGVQALIQYGVATAWVPFRLPE